MNLARYYMLLRQHFSDVDDHQYFQVTVAKLASMFDCTRRNVPLILARMEDNKWITWQPGRGRGNYSRLCFHLPLRELAMQQAQQRVARHDLRGAWDWLSQAPFSTETREQFHRWLLASFGYRTEVRNRKKIDTLRIPQGGPVHTLDPHLTHFAAESQLVRQLYDSLVRYDMRTGTVYPHLAHAWECDRTRTCWTFHLRKGVLFHHGKEMNADDVKISLERPVRLRERMLYRWVSEQIDQINVKDPTTLEIRLRQPNELFLLFLATHRAAIVPSDMADEHAERLRSHPIGTGPFRLTHRDDTTTVMEAFPSYFKERAHLDRLEIWNIPDLYEQKQLEPFQIVPNIGSSSLGVDAGGGKKRENVLDTGISCKFVTFNLRKQGWMHHESMREALALICRGVQIPEEEGYVAYGFFADESSHAYTPEQISTTIQQKLHTAHYEGQVLTICTIPHYQQDAERIRAQCRQVGVHLDIQLLSPEEFKSDRRLASDLLLFALVLNNEAELRLIDLYKSMQRHLPPPIAGELEQRIDELLQEKDAARRKKQFCGIEQRLKRLHLLHVLYKKKLQTAYATSVRGITPDSGEIRFNDIWFDSD